MYQTLRLVTHEDNNDKGPSTESTMRSKAI